MLGGGERGENFALSISSREQTQLNRVCCFLILKVLSTYERSVFPDYLEVATAVVVSVWSLQNFSPCIDIVLIFFHILVLRVY